MPLDGALGLLPGLPAAIGLARRLPLLTACHAKIVASLTAADAMYSKLATCVPMLETGRTLW
jgi:hypothetical protein